MNKLNILSPIFFFFLLFQNSLAIDFSGVPIIHNFNTIELGAGTQNWRIAKDKRGFLYFANNFGLLEFDGEDWRLHTNIRERRRNLKTVLVDDNRIYIGGQNEFGYFEPDETGNLRYESLWPYLEEEYREFDEIWGIYQIQGKVYFTCYDYIFEFDSHDRIKVFQLEQLMRYTFQAGDDLIITAKGKGLYKLKDSKVSFIEDSEIFGEKEIRSIVPMSQNKWLAATLSGEFYEYDGERFKLKWTDLTGLFSKTLINDMISLKSGGFAVAAQNKGIFILDQAGKICNLVAKERGNLPDRTVFNLLEDDHGHLWAALNNGISYIELGSPFSLLSDEFGLLGIGYDALCVDNQLFLGTSNGLFRSIPTKIEGKLDGFVFSMVENTSGQVYNITELNNDVFVGHHKGAFEIEGLNAENINPKSGSWMFQKLVNNPGYMIQGAYDGFYLYELVNGDWKWKHKIKGFSESSRLFSQDRNGEIWMSHGFKGVYRITFNQDLDSVTSVRFYDQTKGFPSNLFINMFEINGKNYFCAERGIYSYDPSQDKMVRDSKLSNLLGNDVRTNELQQDQFGNIYFFTNRKLGMLKRLENGHYIKETDLFNKINYLVSDDLENIINVDENNVLISSTKGFIHYKPGSFMLKKDTFQVYLRSVQSVGDDPRIIYGGSSKGQTKVRQYIELDYEHNDLSFQVSAPFYDGLQHTQYRFHLIGLNAYPDDWGRENTKAYNNLHEGQYELRVSAKNIYGHVAEETLCTIIIHPPWFRSGLAKISYLIIIMSLFFGIYLIQKRRYQERTKRLEKMQQEELEQKDKVLKQTGEEVVRLRNEKLRSEIEHKNKELISSTMHLVNKNEFMIQLNQEIKDFIAKGANETITLEKLTRRIDKNLSDDSDWVNFEKHFDIVHDDFFQKIRQKYPSLSLHDIKLCAYLRLDLTTKEISNLLNLSIRGTETSRYRLRKKLELEKEQNINEFLRSI